MDNFLIRIISVVITSLYFFPFEFAFLPGLNTKMILAGIGLLILVKRMAQNRNAVIDKSFFHLSLLALGVSLASYMTMTYNGTPDNSFLTYIISMWVWLGGAYCVVRWLDFVYGVVSVRLICNYLIAVCVAQCLIAFTMDSYAPLKNLVDSFIGGEAFMGKAETRMYGIGAALDVAGLRFAAVSVIIGFLLSESEKLSNKEILFYIASFMILAVIGNMMSRTTTVGIGIAIMYLLYSNVFIKGSMSKNKRLWLFILGTLCIVLPVIIYHYYTSDGFYKNIRFAFEGFFSLWETGKWEVSSNDILVDHMVVFPDNIRTWIIGDGYAANPNSGPVADPYYTGPSFHGFYMGTDIGYLRFIFYFGLTGTLFFMAFILKAALSCIEKFKSYKMMFLMILLVNYVGWFKVSTDIFLVFALFIALGTEENDKAEKIRDEKLMSL